jgi:hypothetical protein
MSFARFIVAVDDQWNVTVTHNTAAIGAARQMERGQGAKRIWPQAPSAEQATLTAAGRNLDPKELENILDRITKRTPKKNEVATLGAHLFDALLGSALWDAIKASAAAANVPGIELALKFSSAQKPGEDLARLHWEMLRGASGFLVRGFREANRFYRVAVTRMVPGVTIQPRPMHLPPRALFVVGCDINDEKIRPGAEFLGLLRQVRHGGVQRTFHPRVLVQASVERIKQEVMSFHPDIVHFICHGTEDGRLEFAKEPDEPIGTRPRLLTAQEVTDLFKKPDANGLTWTPTIVVLTACHSAQSVIATPSADVHLLTAQHTSPLAASLVADGVAVVVGMAGRVADQACRLYTRSFGEAVCIGRPLVEATEIGRRAAFGTEDPPDSAFDWALPTLFVPEVGVGPDFAPTDEKIAKREEFIDSITVGFAGNRVSEPSFAARIEELESAYSGLTERRTGLLVLTGDNGFGRSRLIQELVGLAVRDGDLPVLYSAHYRGDDKPTDLAKLISALAGALRNTESLYRAKAAAGAALYQTEFLARSKFQDLLPHVSQELDPGPKPTIKAMLAAVQFDLERLLLAAQKIPDSPLKPDGRPILFLDDLEQLGSDFLRGLFSGAEMLVGANGIGSATARIPLVGAYRLSSATQSLYEESLGKIRAPWAHEIALNVFNRQQNEDLAAYRQVLLNPHNKTRPTETSFKRWVIREETGPDYQDYVNVLRKYTKAIPADFDAEKFYMWVETGSLSKLQFVIEADDDKVLLAMDAQT